MLKDGQFIKEPPIRIGAHYVPQPKKFSSEDEWVIQELILGGQQVHRSTSKFDYILYICLVSVVGYAAMPFLRFIVGNLLG